RPWKDTMIWEIIRYIGCLVYMGIHIEPKHEAYWGDSHRLGRFLSLVRFEQIHRYFSLRDGDVHPKQPHEEWFWKVEPVGTLIRLACKANWSLGTHLAVDEA